MPFLQAAQLLTFVHTNGNIYMSTYIHTTLAHAYTHR